MVGLWLLANGSEVAFDAGRALGGIVSQLPATFPAAIALLLGSVMNLGAGAVLVRAVKLAPFGSLAELVVAGLLGAVFLDTLLLFTLGPIGLFRALPLAVIDLGLIAAGALIRPWLVPGRRIPTSGFPLGWLLIIFVWAAPFLLQLASPVVPFLDVLPNHVAPVEHLRAFGSWESLAVSPSPIYGPSRLFLGYVALLGSLGVLTDLPAGIAVAAFALPATVLIAAGASLLAGVLAHGPDPAGAEGSAAERSRSVPRSTTFWVLLTIPLTFVFLRLPDARASVLVFPLVCLALATLVGGRADRAGAGPSLRTGAGRRRAVVLGGSLGAAVLVHPLGGAFAMATVALFALLSPERSRLAMAGIAGGLVLALPQAAVMIGLNAPAWAGLPALPAGLGVAAWLGSTGGGAMPAGLRAPSRDLGLPMILALIVLLGMGIAVLVVAAVTLPNAQDLATGAATTALVDYGVLLLAGALGLVLVRSLDAWRVIGSALVIGLLALGIAEWLPGDGLLIQSISYEVPKAVGYWLPWFVAVAGGLGLAAVWDHRDWTPALRIGICAGFIVLAAVDFQPAHVEEQGIEQHRYADSLAISLHRAQGGYWVGYPDSRQIVDGPRKALLAAVRGEEAAGRLSSSTPVLHVAPSFQQWVATPLGVFAGVIETDATEDPEHSLHTVGGRLFDVTDVPSLLAQGFPYVVVEGYGSSNQYLDAARSAGFTVVWGDEHSTLLHR
ncbi:MAG: hypothetical protein QOH61_2253 [Chloroflexota bacterium]|jgi:hypothetical protein|nr:hypothetical protein [Chloroflexota bacterium]